MASFVSVVGCQHADLRFSWVGWTDRGGIGTVATVAVAGDTRPNTSPAVVSSRSSGVAVFVDQAAEHVDSLHRRYDGAWLDQRQPGRVWWLQVQAAVRSHSVVVA